MKLSISLPAKHVEFIDQQVAEHGERSRSAVVRKALNRLRAESLEDAYVAAWDEWVASGEQEVWDETVGDGLDDGS